MSHCSEQWRQDWAFFKESLVKDFGDFGRVAVFFLNLFSGGWSHMVDQLSAVWNIFIDMLKLGWDSFAMGSVQIFRNILDAFGTFVNGFLELFIGALKLVQAGYGALGMKDKANEVGDAIKSVEAAKLDTQHGDRARMEYQGQKDTIAKDVLDNAEVLSGEKKGPREQAKYDQADAEAQNAGGDTNNKTTKIDVHVNVPHGTSRETAEKAGQASEEGVRRGMQKSLIPGDG